MIRIEFENPAFLWYLLSLPLIIYTHFYVLRHTKLQAMKFANFDALRRVSGGKLLTKNILLLVIRVLTLLCVIIALSGTTVWYTGKISQSDFVIAIDNSASMSAEDVPPTRLEAAKKTAIDLVGELKAQSNIGLLSFSGTTTIESTLINNRESLVKTIDNIQIANAGGTDLAGAIITGTNLLAQSEKGKTIIIITDGSNTVGAFIENSLKQGEEYANKNHVVVHTIGIGSETGPLGYLPDYYNISSVYNENNLMQISNSTSGLYFHAIDSETLKKAYQEISSTSDSGLIPLRLAKGMLIIALLLLFLDWGLISTRFRRIP